MKYFDDKTELCSTVHAAAGVRISTPIYTHFPVTGGTSYGASATTPTWVRHGCR